MCRCLWFKKLSLIGLILLLSSCKTQPKAVLPPIQESAQSPSAEIEHVLVADGESLQPMFSPDGQSLLFVSAKRKGHQLAQVYEKNLTSGEERRVTFQSGQTSHPTYHPRERLIAYASSTDEIKEQPLRQPYKFSTTDVPREFQENVEIYTHSLTDFNIHRASRREGFDGEPRFGDDGSLTYTRATPRSLEIMRSSSAKDQSQNLRALGLRASNFISREKQKFAAWLEWNPDFLSNVIKIRKGHTKPMSPRTDFDSLKLDLQISPDGKWILWSQATGLGFFELWLADLETLCPRLLLSQKESSLRHPALAPNAKTLAYTKIDKDGSRIFWRTFEPPPGSCPTAH